MLKGFRSEKTDLNHEKVMIHSSLPIPFLLGVKRFSKKTLPGWDETFLSMLRI